MTETAKRTAKRTKKKAVADREPGRLLIEDGVVWLRLDDPRKRVNTLSTAYFEWFERQLDRIENEDARGLVFVSDKPGTFIVGADIEELRAFSDPQAVQALIRRGHALLDRLIGLPFPVVAAIDGACLGGGLELALACDARAATNAGHTRLGLPEVKLGLIPGLGGTQRLPRLIGVPPALDMILTGKEIAARKAKKLGLVDELCAPQALAEAALRLVGRGKPGTAGYRGPERAGARGLVGLATDLLARIPGARMLVYEKAKDTVVEKSGGHYPAPLKAIEVVRRGLDRDLARGLEIEAEAFAEMVVTDVAKSLIHIFFAKQAVDGGASSLAKAGTELERVAVLGAGFMGAGITQGLAYRGLEVILKDKDHEGLGRGLRQCHELFRGLEKRRKLRPVEVKAAMSRILPAIDYDGFRRVPLVIEAVFEDLDVKHRVLREVEAVAPPEMIFASNTSTIPIARLAEASQRPEQVVGMHFFSPVHKMPLLEVIRHPGTSEGALATVVELGRRMGKTIIVVNDGPGFFTSRVLGPFVNEALWLLDQGVRIETIDRAVTSWGWPVGPLALLDEVGIDIAQHAGGVIAEYAGERAEVPEVFDRLVAAGRLGRKSGRGFYDYRKKPKQVDESVYELIGWEESEVGAEEIAERCWLQMLNEVARCIEEGIIEDPHAVDIGVIFGFGFPPFRGGILRHADSLGIDRVVGRLESYAETQGQRLAPADLLRQMAERGERFYANGKSA